MGKVVVNEKYLELLQAGLAIEHLNMYAAQNGLVMKERNGQLSVEKGNVATEWAQSPVDTRYNVPKEAPKASEDIIDKTIAETEIYRRAKLALLGDEGKTQSSIYYKAKDVILQAQRKQVAYGIDKYPEPLNPNTWSISETIDHILDESIDRIHYLVMLLIKFEQSLAGKKTRDGSRTWSILESITKMIEDAIEELYSLVILNLEIEREMEKDVKFTVGVKTEDAMDNMRYAIEAMNHLNVHGKAYVGGADLDGDTHVTINAYNEQTKKTVDAIKSIDIDELLNRKAGLI